MGKLDTIKKELEVLSAEEQREIIGWLVDIQERLFDERLQRDSEAGRLDSLMGEAMREHEIGRTRPL